MIYIIGSGTKQEVLDSISNGTYLEDISKICTCFIKDYDSTTKSHDLVFMHNNKIYRTKGFVSDQGIYADLEENQLSIGYFTQVTNKNKQKVTFNGFVNMFSVPKYYYKVIFHYTPHDISECVEVANLNANVW